MQNVNVNVLEGKLSYFFIFPEEASQIGTVDIVQNWEYRNTDSKYSKS